MGVAGSTNESEVKFVAQSLKGRDHSEDNLGREDKIKMDLII
jgi:hypothetical protein